MDTPQKSYMVISIAELEALLRHAEQSISSQSTRASACIVLDLQTLPGQEQIDMTQVQVRPGPFNLICATSTQT